MVRCSVGRVALLCGLGAVLAACASSRAYRPAEVYADEVNSRSTAEYYAEGDSAGADLYAPAPEPQSGATGGAVLANRPARGRSGKSAPPPPPAPPPGQSTPTADATAGAGADAPAPTAAPSKRLMIYRASYQIVVSSVDKSIEELLLMVKTRGGYLEARQDATLTLRVPADLYFEVLDLLPRFGRITQQNLQAVDVTRQFADLQLRIANARASRDRLAKLLEQANKMEDIIKIEAELRRLTEEIERMEGELRGIGDQIAFSTLTVTFLSNAPEPSVYPQRQVSRFDWINQVGLEAVQYGF